MGLADLPSTLAGSIRKKNNGQNFSNILDSMQVAFLVLGKKFSGKKEILAKLSNGVRIFHPDINGFVISYREIFIDQNYYFKPPCDRSHPFIIDCGGNAGMSVLFFKLLYPSSKVLVFEPDPTLIGYITKNMAANKISDVNVLPFAVFDSEKEMSLFDDKRGITLGNSLFENFFSGNGKKKARTVLLSNYIAEPVDLLKLDIEGSESNVLNDLKKNGKLNLIDKIIMEYHPGINTSSNSLAGILSILESSGFSYGFGKNRDNSFANMTKQGVFMIYAWRDQK